MWWIFSLLNPYRWLIYSHCRFWLNWCCISDWVKYWCPHRSNIYSVFFVWRWQWHHYVFVQNTAVTGFMLRSLTWFGKLTEEPYLPLLCIKKWVCLQNKFTGALNYWVNFAYLSSYIYFNRLCLYWLFYYRNELLLFWLSGHLINVFVPKTKTWFQSFV